MLDVGLGPYAHPAQAVLALRQALAREPESPGLLRGLAALLLKLGRFEEAYVLLETRRTSRETSDFPGYLHAWACLGSGRMDTLFERLAGHPQEGPWCLDLGTEAGLLGRWDLAVRLLERAHDLLPGDAEAIQRLGSALEQNHRFDDAIRLLAQALESREASSPEHARLRLHLGEDLLRLGDFARGLPLLESRFEVENTHPAPLSLAPWRGESLEGRSILLRGEQGYGDMFMFLRYAGVLAARGARVLVEALPHMTDLQVTCPGVHAVVPGGAALPADTLQAPLGSLPLLCGTEPHAIPAAVPYLRVPERVPHREVLDACLGLGRGTRRIGLVWAGNPRHPRDWERSIPPEALDLLGDVPGITWYSLQLRATATPALPLVDLAPHLGDFADTAYALERLDGLISADTSPVHLAGALGRPVWAAVAHVPDWRWLLSRSDSPWYPTLELWRQSVPGDWPSVFASLALRLKVSGFPCGFPPLCPGVFWWGVAGHHTPRWGDRGKLGLAFLGFQLGGHLVQVRQQPVGEVLVLEDGEVVALHFEDLDGELALGVVRGVAVGVGLDLGQGSHDREVAAFEVHLLQDGELFLFAVLVFQLDHFDFIVVVVVAVGSVDVVFVGHEWAPCKGSRLRPTALGNQENRPFQVPGWTHSMRAAPGPVTTAWTARRVGNSSLTLSPRPPAVRAMVSDATMAEP